MNSELIKVIANHVNETNSLTDVDMFVEKLQETLTEKLKFETKVSKASDSIKILFQDSTDDSSIIFKELNIVLDEEFVEKK